MRLQASNAALSRASRVRWKAPPITGRLGSPSSVRAACGTGVSVSVGRGAGDAVDGRHRRQRNMHGSRGGDGVLVGVQQRYPKPALACRKMIYAQRLGVLRDWARVRGTTGESLGCLPAGAGEVGRQQLAVGLEAGDLGAGCLGAVIPGANTHH